MINIFPTVRSQFSRTSHIWNNMTSRYLKNLNSNPQNKWKIFFWEITSRKKNFSNSLKFNMGKYLKVKKAESNFSAIKTWKITVSGKSTWTPFFVQSIYKQKNHFSSEFFFQIFTYFFHIKKLKYRELNGKHKSIAFYDFLMFTFPASIIFIYFFIPIIQIFNSFYFANRCWNIFFIYKSILI